MASLKAKIIQGIIRKQHLLKGQLKRKPFIQSVEAVLKFRNECEKGAKRFGKLSPNIRAKQEVINLIQSEWLVPENAKAGKLIFYVHGGGYVSGSCNDHRAIVSKITAKTRITTFLYEYGLAPEHPYPAAVDDSLNMYKTVLEKGYKPENIIVVGESAGGGLALALLLALKDKNMPLPQAAVAITPWVDLSCTNRSFKTKNKISVAPLNCWNVFSHYYVGKNDVHNPYISPLYGNLEGLPPIYINAGEADELFDDAYLFYQKAKSAGVNIVFKGGKDMVHCYPLMAPMFKEATEAFNEIIDYLNTKLEVGNENH